MMSMTRHEFDALSATLTQTWIEAQWATWARRARRQALLPESLRDPIGTPARLKPRQASLEQPMN